MNISENEQGSYEWKEERYGSIGGTNLKDLMVKKPIEESALFDRLIAAHTEPFFDEETFTSKDMERGILLEPEAREEAGEYLGLHFLEFGTCKREDLAINHCSPDGFTANFKDGLEVKCPTGATHIKYCRENKIPSEYVFQVVNYFLINQHLERLHFVSYRPENTLRPLFVLTVTRSTEINTGTKAKEKLETIQSLVEQAEIKSLTIARMIEEEIEKLSF